MRGKRRTRGTWFPLLNTVINAGEDFVTIRAAALDIPAAGNSIAAVVPLTYDDPRDTDEQADFSQLTEFVGQEYILHSILGKIFCSYNYRGDPTTNRIPPYGVWAKAGFFVARADDSNTIGDDQQPIGATTIDEVRRNYSPLNPNTLREPWIWQRTWALGRGFPRRYLSGATEDGIGINTVTITANAPAEYQNLNAFPSTNVEYGSLLDGPNVKTKTRRRVRQDERLWLALAAHQMGSGHTADVANVTFSWDLRLFAQLVKAVNRSAF